MSFRQMSTLVDLFKIGSEGRGDQRAVVFDDGQLVRCMTYSDLSHLSDNVSIIFKQFFLCGVCPKCICIRLLATLNVVSRGFAR